jgi:hypothetical protein
MNKEQQQIKIAEACGWTILEPEIHPTITYMWGYPSGVICGPQSIVPEYTDDLNAMHQAEKIFKLGMRNRYDAELGLIAERDYCFIWETSAAQRAEAFLRTLDLWEE